MLVVRATFPIDPDSRDEALELIENVNREKMRAMARADDSGQDGEEGASIYWRG